MNMSGQRGHVGCKRPREVFLTPSTSLSLSSLSSSCTSSDDAIEIRKKAARTSYEDQIRGKSSFPGSEISCVTTHVRRELAPPSSRPVQLMDMCLGTQYDPERIPASVFAKTGGDFNWSAISNDSLFSLRMSTCQALSQSKIKLEDGEFLAYSPSLLVYPENAEEEKRSQVTEETASVKTNTHQERSSTSTTPPVSFDQLYQAPLRKSQAFPLPLGEKKNKKRKKTRGEKTNKKEQKKKQDVCCIWSWLCSGVLKCKWNFHWWYKWRNCCFCCCCC